MKEKIVISCLVVGLQILCIASQAYAIPTSTPSSTTTTQIPINATKKPANRTVLLAASSLPKSSDLKKLDPGQNGTNVTAKFANDGEHPIQQIGDGVQLAKEKENATIQVVKESGIEDTNLKLVSSKPAPLSDEDKKFRRAWGGNCTAAVWDVCNKIKFWGGNYVIPDKKNPGKFIVKNYKIHCVEKPDKTFCLRNGWTVARCHMLCMSQCNIEYRQSYDKLVAHEGECRMPIFRKR
ncbi:unnamed protein product [Orchesella dallaii]|uniref:Uncharacterized protein n=1 Tax=Orchesella dallaii TaxID=48710 RepID=A0ABP1Q905_9HEXA